ncbi:MAG: cytochrome [Anaerocolumna sp.]|nr:cytochrome [Anaerocolumna sp.]
MSSYSKVPMDKMLDSSICLLLDGYQFIQKRCRKYQSDLFITRIMGQKVICMSGEEAGKIFYDEKRFQRKGAAPKRVQKTLVGQNGVQGLDGNAHKQRKQMFMSIMTPQNLKVLVNYTREQWSYNSIRWVGKEIILFDEAQRIMCQVACRWAGVPLKYIEINQRASDLGKMIDGFATVGTRYHQGKCARKRTESWIRGIIEDIRLRRLKVDENSAAYKIAWHKESNGKYLTTQIAAVELINIIRPIVAIATYVTFGALALYKHPECRILFQLRDDNYNQMFAQEVRRFYPFAPFVGTRVKRDFLWRNCYFKKGDLVMFDIYGTDHDSRIYLKPYEFIPERFANKETNPFQFVPQGGGDSNMGHRCAGELVTLEVMKASLDFLSNHMDYKVPRQDLRYSLNRMPTLPKSRLRIHVLNRVVD